MGDIHGRWDEFKQALHRSAYDMTLDKLVLLGDLMDRGPDPKRLVGFLVGLRDAGADLVFVGGNHDLWFLEDVEEFRHGEFLYTGADFATAISYRCGVPPEHMAFLRAMVPYHVEKRTLFVHGGYDPSLPIEGQTHDQLAWNRTLWHRQCSEVEKRNEYDRVFIGHTCVDQPQAQGRVINIDTAAGYSGGFVTVMDADTGEWWRSDRVASPLASVS